MFRNRYTGICVTGNTEQKNVNVSIESDFLQPHSSINNSICTARPPGLRPKHQDLYVFGFWLRKISAIKDMK
jgi:hypothetical protein